MDKTDQVKLEVASPLSEVHAHRGNAPRLETLKGKRVCEVWATGHYGGERTFPIIRRILQERFDGVEIVPYTEFEIGKPKATQRWGPLEKVAAILKEKECDAVVVGNGG